MKSESTTQPMESKSISVQGYAGGTNGEADRYFSMVEGDNDYRKSLVVGIPDGFVLEGIRPRGAITVTKGFGGEIIHDGQAIEIIIRREKEME